MIRGTARFVGPYEVEVTGVEGTQRDPVRRRPRSPPGRGPRIPEWCTPDGDRILTTRDCYPPKDFPESVTVIGSGVTGVEFVHMFSSFGAKVTLVVSRQQVLPGQGPRGRGGARGRLPAPRRQPAEGRPGDGDRPRPRHRRRRRALRRRPGRALVARRAGHRLGAQQRRPRARGRRRRDRRRRLRADRPQLRHQRAATSTPPATSAGSCRCRRSRRCRAARSPSG